MSLPRDAHVPTAPDDDAVAWQLVATARPHLSRADADTIHIHIGVGDTFDAIATLLTVIVRDHVPLGHDLTATVAMWLDCYRGHEAEPHLQNLLALAAHRVSPLSTGSEERVDAAPGAVPQRRQLG